ncbi:hypothetical protein ACJJTC_015617 [Scirpophaga incertulas]
MSYPIKYLSLQKAELIYEVELRGGTGDSVQELRKQIIKLAQTLPADDILESHLDPADDLKEVKESLLKSQNNLISLKKERFLICFKCGKKGVRYPECPDCNPKIHETPKN